MIKNDYMKIFWQIRGNVSILLRGKGFEIAKSPLKICGRRFFWLILTLILISFSRYVTKWHVCDGGESKACSGGSYDLSFLDHIMRLYVRKVKIFVQHPKQMEKFVKDQCPRTEWFVLLLFSFIFAKNLVWGLFIRFLSFFGVVLFLIRNLL